MFRFRSDIPRHLIIIFLISFSGVFRLVAMYQISILIIEIQNSTNHLVDFHKRWMALSVTLVTDDVSLSLP